MRPKLSKIIKSGWFIGGVAFVLGAGAILAIRFATYHPADEVHYHANFAVYINGQREKFKDQYYYQAIEEACEVKKHMTPHERAHMHDNVNDVVHVEDEAVTWGNFFQNIGWTVNPKLIQTPSQTLLVQDSNKISFILNGEATDNLVGRVIKDQDRLLVDYGDSPEQVLQEEYSSVASTAVKYDNAKDPATCGGSQRTTSRDRLRHMF